jgi:hypothetical protein
LVTYFLDSVLFLLYNIFLKENIMACTGYDSKAVKLPKAIKRRSATIVDAHKRGAFIRSYVQVLISDAHQSKSRNFKEKK